MLMQPACSTALRQLADSEGWKPARL